MRIKGNIKNRVSNGHKVKIISSMILNGQEKFIVESIYRGWWLLVDKENIIL